MWKALKLFWLEIRPNAAWDLVKYMLFGGVAGLVVIGYRVLAYVRELPQDRVIDVAIFATSFVLILGAYGLAKYRLNQMLQMFLAPQVKKLTGSIESASKGLDDADEKTAPSPSERIYVNVTPEYLTSFYNQHTAFQAAKLVEPYIGKWITVFGIVNDVTSESRGTKIYIVRPKEDSGFLLIVASFHEQTWIDRIVLLRREDKVAVVGQIKSVDSRSVWLDYCETIQEEAD